MFMEGGPFGAFAIFAIWERSTRDFVAATVPCLFVWGVDPERGFLRATTGFGKRIYLWRWPTNEAGKILRAR